MENVKPDLCCHPDCTNCPYEDCLYNGDMSETESCISESVEQFAMMQRAALQGTSKFFCYNHSSKGRIRQYRYNHSEKGEMARQKYKDSPKGKDALRRYNQSEKGQLSRKRYSESEKGKINEKKKQARKIASGKNAEYCRRYYQRKKLQMIQEQAG